MNTLGIFTTKVIALSLGFLLLTTALANAESPALPSGDPPAPAALKDSVSQLQLNDAQKRSAEAIVKSYEQKQKQAEAGMLYQLKNVLPAAEFSKLVDSLNHPTTQPAAAASQGAVADATDAPQIPVKFAGGFDTDPRDHGRPVVLVAAGLSVPTDVFRKAFSGVHPAGPNSGGPTDAEARSNKQALLSVLAPYGVTDARLNEVSNYYRYNKSAGEMWKHVDATAVALVKDGKVVSVKITNPGAGYSSTPTAEVPQVPGVKLDVKVSYQTDLTKNGSIGSIEVK